MSYTRTSTRVFSGRQLRLRCAHCATEFDYKGTGINPPKLCSDFCRTQRRHANSKAKPLCVVPGCRNARHYRDGTCNSCYYRRRRTGTLDRKAHAYRSMQSSGYIALTDREHELSGKDGFLYEHRKVLFDEIGMGPHLCRWCGKHVEWKSKSRNSMLVVDHLDGDKANNDVTNLAPSCQGCNGRRGLFQAWVIEHKDDPWLLDIVRTAAESKPGGVGRSENSAFG